MNPWSSIHIPPVTTAMSSCGEAGECQTTTAGACALPSLGFNKNFTIFHKAVILDLTSKGAGMPTGAKFALAYVWENRITPQIFRIKLFINSIKVKQVLNDYKIHAVIGTKCVHYEKTAIQSKSHQGKLQGLGMWSQLRWARCPFWEVEVHDDISGLSACIIWPTKNWEPQASTKIEAGLQQKYMDFVQHLCPLRVKKKEKKVPLW